MNVCVACFDPTAGSLAGDTFGRVDEEAIGFAGLVSSSSGPFDAGLPLIETVFFCGVRGRFGLALPALLRLLPLLLPLGNLLSILFWFATTAEPNLSSLLCLLLASEPGVRGPKVIAVFGWKKMPAGLPSGLCIIIPLAPLLPILAAVSLKYSSASAGSGLLGERADDGPKLGSCDLPDMLDDGECMKARQAYLESSLDQNQATRCSPSSLLDGHREETANGGLYRGC